MAFGPDGWLCEVRVWSRLRRVFATADPDYDRWVSRYAARTAEERWLVAALHLLPGLVAWLLLRWTVPTVHEATGIGLHWLQLGVLATMAIGWELMMPFVWLRRDGLTFASPWHASGSLVICSGSWWSRRSSLC